MAQQQVRVHVNQQDVVQSQMFLDQQMDTLNTLETYLHQVKQGQAQGSLAQVLATTCVTSLNCFALSANERHQKRDNRSLTLASQRLTQWAQTQKMKKREFDAMAGMLKFMHCCCEKEIDMKREALKNLDFPNAYGKDFTTDNVGRGMGQYMASGHTVRDRVDTYSKSYQAVDRNLNQQYESCGRRKSKLFNDSSVPNSDDIYKASVSNPRYRIRNSKHGQAPDLDEDMMVEDDMVMYTNNDEEGDVDCCGGPTQHHQHQHQHHVKSKKKKSTKKPKKKKECNEQPKKKFKKPDWWPDL